MFLKVHCSPGTGDIVAVCDRELLNTTISNGELSVQITEWFYGNSPASEEMVRAALKKAGNINLMGKRSVSIDYRHGARHSVRLYYDRGNTPCTGLFVMSIQDCFCPKCGMPTEHEGLCSNCRIGNTPWFECDRRVKSTHCPSCGAIKQVNTWTDTNRERAELAPELAKTAVHFHPDVRKPSMVVKVEDNTLNRSTADDCPEGITLQYSR